MLRQTETVALDRGRLGDLYQQLGPASAENVLCRTLEELALRMTQLDRSHAAGNHDAMRKSAKLLSAIADQIGMDTLARVSRDLIGCIDAGDGIAIAAVLARLIRSGESSLTAIWDLQDVTL